MEPAAQRAQFATYSHAVAIDADTVESYRSELEFDVVLECSGSAAATATALKLLAPGGILVVVGAGRPSSRLAFDAGRTRTDPVESS
jgi:threonine dehydrogenase-like Zn-dependent dehydrogenase